MELRSVTILTQDGAKSEAVLCLPDNTPSNILFLCLPAMGVKAGYYSPLSEALTEQGYSVLLCDLRGQGTSDRKVPPSEFGYCEMIELDISAHIRAAKEICPDRDIVLLGHSLGGHLSLLYTAAHPEEVKAVALIASGSVYFRAYPFPQNLKIWIAIQCTLIMSALFGYFPGPVSYTHLTLPTNREV